MPPQRVCATLYIDVFLLHARDGLEQSAVAWNPWPPTTDHTDVHPRGLTADIRTSIRADALPVPASTGPTPDGRLSCRHPVFLRSLTGGLACRRGDMFVHRPVYRSSILLCSASAPLAVWSDYLRLRHRATQGPRPVAVCLALAVVLRQGIAEKLPRHVGQSSERASVVLPEIKSRQQSTSHQALPSREWKMEARRGVRPR